MNDKQKAIEKIEEGLQKLRPFLQADGGDIEFVDLTEDMEVKVRLTGACETCPMSLQTLRAGVEHTLRAMIPEIKTVTNCRDSSMYESDRL